MLEKTIAQKSIKLLLLESQSKFNNPIARWLDESRDKINLTRVDSAAIAMTRMKQETFDLVLLALFSGDREENIKAIAQCFPLNREENNPVEDRYFPNFYFSQPPLILLSDRDDPELARLALRAGVQDFLVLEDLNRRQFLRILRHTTLRHSINTQKQCDRCPIETNWKFAAQILKAIAKPVFVKNQENQSIAHSSAEGTQHTISTKKSIFTHPDGEKPLIGCISDIIQQKQQEAIGQKRQRYLAALVAIGQKLLDCQNPCSCYDNILHILGTTSGASRVYLFENDRDELQGLRMSQKAEWCAEGINPEINNPIYQNLPYKDFSLEFAEILRRGETISDLVTNLSSPMQEILTEQEILSILVLPLQVNGIFFGFIGFDNCVEAKIWDASEVSLLQSVAVSISSTQQRWQTEVALKESEERYRYIVETANEGIIIIDRQGCIDFANHRAANTIGYDPKDIIGKSYTRFINAEMREIFAPILQQPQTVGSEQYDLKLTHRSGESVWVMISISPLWQKGQFIGSLGMMTDITQRKKAEADRDRFFTLSADLLCIAGIDGYFKRINPAWSKILGHSHATLLAQPYLEFVHPDDRDSTLAETQTLGKGGVLNVNFQNRYRCANGDYKWLAWSATSYLEEGLIYAVARDITPEKESQAALQESTQRLAEAQKVTHVGDWEIDLISGRVTWSDELFRIYGLENKKQDNLSTREFISSSTPIGQEYLQYIHPDDRLASQEAMQRAISTGQPYELEQRIQRPDGEIHYLLLRGQPVTNDTGEVIRLFGTALDISDRKQVEATLEHRMAIEALVTHISTQFINLDANEIDRGINDTLQQIGIFAKIDRAYLYQLSDNGETISKTHEWCAMDIDTQREQLEEVSVTAFPWALPQLKRGQVLHVPNLYLLPVEASVEQAKWEAESIQSILCLPMTDRGRFVGFVGFDAVGDHKRWTVASMNVLRLVGEIFTNALERKRVEEALQLTKFAVDRATDAIFRIDSQGNFSYVNQAACRSLDYSSEELLQLNISDIDPNLPVKIFSEYWRRIKDTGYLIFESIHCTKDDRTFPVEMSVNYLEFKGEEFCFCFVRDISERQAAHRDRQQADIILKESEEKYRNLQETFSDAILIADLEGNLLGANRKAEELLGYSKAELSQMHFSQIHPPEELPKAIANFQKDALTKSPSYFADTLVLTKDGQRISVDISSNFSKVGGKWLVQGVFYDITDRKQAEAKIQYRLSLERLIATISSQFINLESEEVKFGIQAALQQVGKFAEVDRCYVFAIDSERQTMRNLYEWCTPGVQSHRATGEDVPLSVYPWFIGQIQRFEVVNVPRLGDLPPEAGFEKECLEAQSVLSMLNVPMLVRGKLLGFMGFDAVHSEKQWNADDIGLLRIIGEIFAHTLERQRAELQVRESEERFRQLAENIASVFWMTDWMTDPAKQQIIYVSPAYETIWGRACEEVYTRPLSFIEAIHADDRDRVIAAFPQQICGKYDEEYRILRPDGEIRWIRDRAFPICNKSGQVYRVAGIAEDISDRKRSDEALRAIAEGTAAQIGSEFFRSLVRHLAEVLQVRYAFISQCLDPEKTRVRTLAFWQGQDFGDNFEYDLAHTPCESVIQGKVCLYPCDSQKLFPKDEDLVTLNVESYSAIPLNDSGGNILGHLAIMDVKPMTDTRTPELIVRIFAARAGAELERLQAEEALQTSKERLQLALEGSALGLWDWHLTTGETYFSPQWKTMLGYREEELENVYGTWERLVHPEDLPEVLDILHAHIEGRTPVYQAEFRMATKQGDWKWICARAQVFEWDEEGKPVRMTGTHKDISDRKAIDRMKDELISVISHELRTPMTSVRGALGLLATGKLGELTNKGQSMLEIAINNTDRLSRLINDILDLQRIESGQFNLKFQRCNAYDLCTQALEMLQDLAQKRGVTFSLSCADTSEIWVDPDYFMQILSNLLTNAIKFSEPGMVVSLEAREDEGQFLFCVGDRGRGIAPEHQDSIFERFHQVDASDSRQKGGTGLGLAICRSLVELHGGKIWVKSTVGEGSSFYVMIPLESDLI
ncbi:MULTISPECIES: PAS domain S-box protein [Spirulina sp. CCY15215]|uniref:PAS domain S-box protein n=1 Tax=Spirulina sp. CCY15215 TaxID=2767591 RepID=UPI00195042DA|nr:PAS domain S-box protein [Spirulina major]